MPRRRFSSRYLSGLALFAGSPVVVAASTFHYYATHRFSYWTIEDWIGLPLTLLLAIPAMAIGLAMMRDSVP